jgi:dihydrofolate reductase
VTLTVIVAVAENGVIGRENDLPWRLPADLKRFKRLTMGHPIVMGRRTWESIGRPLPGRTSVVLTRRDDFALPEGVLRAGSLDDALEHLAGEEEVFVIGGASVYAEALPRADRVQLTRVHAEPPGDVRFPGLEASRWRAVAEERHVRDDRHEHDFTFFTYERA